MEVKVAKKEYYKMPESLKKQGGYKVNWNKVQYYMDSLKIPPNVYQYPLKEFYNYDWFNMLSIRSRGKTTNAILPIIILYLMYGQQSVYLRTDEKDLKTAFISKMFGVILENDYISELSGGKWNFIKYYNKEFYLCKNVKGEITDIAETPFLIVLSINMNEDIKSTLNIPNCYLFLFDEYLKQNYPYNGFYNLCNIIDTVRRYRIDVKVIMPSNLVNPYSPWFEEMDIREYIDEIRMGEVKRITLNGGARMYLEYINDKQAIQEEDIRTGYDFLIEIRKKFFGFNNSRLSSITGGGKWELKQYPHLTKRLKDERRKIVDRDIYIRFNSYWLCLELSISSVMGEYVNVRMYGKDAEPMNVERSRVYVMQNPRHNYEAYGMGCTMYDKYLWNIFKEQRFFYATNEVGRMVEEFVQDTKDDIFI